MPNLTIKNLPAKVHRILKAESSQRGQSLNTFVIEILSDRALWPVRRKRMNDAWPLLMKHLAGLPTVPDSTEILREVQTERETLDCS